MFGGLDRPVRRWTSSLYCTTMDPRRQALIAADRALLYNGLASTDCMDEECPGTSVRRAQTYLAYLDHMSSCHELDINATCCGKRVQMDYDLTGFVLEGFHVGSAVCFVSCHVVLTCASGNSLPGATHDRTESRAPRREGDGIKWSQKFNNLNPGAYLGL